MLISTRWNWGCRPTTVQLRHAAAHPIWLWPSSIHRNSPSTSFICSYVKEQHFAARSVLLFSRIKDITYLWSKQTSIPSPYKPSTRACQGSTSLALRLFHTPLSFSYFCPILLEVILLWSWAYFRFTVDTFVAIGSKQLWNSCSYNCVVSLRFIAWVSVHIINSFFFWHNNYIIFCSLKSTIFLIFLFNDRWTKCKLANYIAFGVDYCAFRCLAFVVKSMFAKEVFKVLPHVF